MKKLVIVLQSSRHQHRALRTPSNQTKREERLVNLICTLHCAWKHGDDIDEDELAAIKTIVEAATGEQIKEE